MTLFSKFFPKVPQSNGWIKGVLTLDADHDGDRLHDEALEGYTVELLDLDGNVVASSVTDKWGKYLFDVPAGEYRVKFPSVEGFVFTDKDAANDHYDSDANADGLTDTITLRAHHVVDNVDAGIKPIPVGSVSGRVFHDADHDGKEGKIVESKGPNLIENGDFEINHGEQFDLRSHDLAGWDVHGYTADLLTSTVEGHDNVAGNAILELDKGSSISQNVKLDEGSYHLSFDVFPSSDTDARNNSIKVFDGWKWHQFDVTENKTIKLEIEVKHPAWAKIKFQSNSWDKGAGVAIDNVELREKTFDATAIKGPNLIVNGDFEINDGEQFDLRSHDLAGWDVHGYTADLLTSTVEGHDNADGNAILELDRGSSISQNVKLDEGSYHLSFDVFPSSDTAAWNNSIKVFDGWKWHQFDVTENKTIKLEIEVKHPAWAKIKFQSNSWDKGAGVAIDNVELREKTFETKVTKGPNLIENGDFEINHGEQFDLRSHDLAGWDVHGYTADLLTSTVEGHDNVAGNAILELDKGSSISQNVKLDEGSYHLSFDVFPSSDTDARNNSIKVFDGWKWHQFDVTENKTIKLEIEVKHPAWAKIKFQSNSWDKGAGVAIDNVELREKTETPIKLDEGKEGVTVQLVDVDGNAVLDEDGNAITTVTDADGNYSFDGIPVGDYRVRVLNPDLTAFTTQNVGGAEHDNIDSDFNAEGLSDIFTITKGGETTDIDAGLKKVDNVLEDGDESATTDEDTPVAIDNLLANTVDPEAGDPVVIDAGGTPVGAGETVTVPGTGGGIFTIASDGTASFDPNGEFETLAPGESVDVTLTYSVEDANGAQVSSTITITVTGVNDAPDAVDDTAVTDEDTPVTIPVLDNDSDPEDDPLTVVAADSPDGSVVINADGTVTFTPDENFNGETTITYTIEDPDGLQDTATVTVTVNPENDLPEPMDDDNATAADPDAFITDEDTVLDRGDNVLANDVDPDGDPLTVVAINGAADLADVPASQGGLVTIAPDGTLSFDPNGEFEDLAPGETRDTSVTYTVDDGNGGQTDATVTITVTGVNDAPDAVDDTAVTDEDTPVTIPVLDNDSDPEDDPLTVVAADSPDGSVVINADGTVTFTPDENFNGETTITYTIEDPDGLQDTATVTVTVNPENDLPEPMDDDNATAADPDAFITDEDTVLDRGDNVLANDVDPDGDPLTVVAINGAADLADVPASQGGLVTIAPDGTLSFDPNGEFEDLAPGETRDTSVTYTVDDGNGGQTDATVTITVTGVNDAPDAVDDTAVTDEDTPVTIPVLDNDSDPEDDPLTVVAADSPDGSVVINADGTVTFTPDENFNGETTITYTIEDPDGLQDTATVTVTVTPENDLPEPMDDDNATAADPDAFITDEDTVLDRGDNVLANDVDPDGDPLTVVAINGAADLADVPASQGGLVTIAPDGTLSFDPNGEFEDLAPGETRDTSVTYTVDDGNGGQTDATVTITVTGVNDAPDAVDDTAVTDEDTPVTIPVLDNDSDPEDDPLTVVAADSPDGSVVINADGTVTFTPDENFNGETTITYTIEDPDGLQDTATVTVTVTPENDLPEPMDDDNATAADPDAFITDEDTVLDRGDNVLANDVDPDGDPLTVVAINGAADLADVPASQGGLVTIAPDGTLSFDPNGEFEDLAPGETRDTSVTYTVDDGNGGQTDATVTITVTGVNDAPDAVDDTAVTDEDTPVTIPVLDNDSDPEDDPLTVVAADSPDGSVVINADGTVTFTPDENFNGETTITYTIEDPDGLQDTATVTVTVTPENDLPEPMDDDNATAADPDAFITDEDTVLDRGDNVLANDVDPDGDPLTVVAINGAADLADVPASQGGLVTIAPDGTLSFDPNGEFEDLAPGETRDTSVTYTVDDGNGGQTDATVTITVTGVNDAPDAVDDTAVTDEDTPVTIPVLDNDSDPEDDPLTVVAADSPDGSVVINADGTVTFTPDENFNGETTITYTIEDPDGLQDTATVTVTVTPENDLPEPMDDDNATAADPDAFITDEDTVLDRGDNVLANDVDPDGDPLTVVAINGAADLADVPASQGGLVTIAPDGTLSFDPNGEFEDLAPGETRDTSVTYTVDDGNGGQTDATVTITVTGVNDAPDAVDDTAVTDEDTPVTIPVLDNDSDPEDDPLTVVAADSPDGSVVINADGTVTFTPDENFNGETTITYTIEDPDGLQDTATVTVTVTPENDLPEPMDDDNATAADPDAFITDEDTVLDRGDNVLANDVDPDGDPLTVVAINGAADLADVPASQGGLVTIAPDGTLSFDPNGEFEDLAPGETRDTSVTYTVDDGNGGQTDATVTITVTGVNDAPDAVDDTAVTDEDTPVTIPVLDNDSDPEDDPLTVVAADSPDGSVVINADGTVTFTPDENFNGETTITYTIEDPDGLQDTATVTVTVNPENDLPEPMDDDNATAADPDAFITDEDTVLDRGDNVLANDVDPDGDPLTVVAINGAADLADVPASQGGLVTIAPDGTLSFDPNGEFEDLAPGETRDTSVTYTVDDGNGGQTDATVTITVTGVNDAPDAVDDTAVTDEDTPVTIPVLDNDSDPEDDPLTVVAADSPDGSVVINADGTVTFTPDENFNGETTITYTIEDPDGLQDTATVTVTVTPENDLPEPMDDDNATAADPDAFITDEDTVLDRGDNVLANDVDPDGDPLTVVAINGAADLADVPASQGGLVTIAPDGTLSFDPNGEFEDLAPGETRDTSVTYTVDDGNGGQTDATVTITVTGVNDLDDGDETAETDEDTPVAIDNLLANSVDPEAGEPTVVAAGGQPVPAGGSVTVAGVGGGLFTIASDGTASFDPNGEFEGLNPGETAEATLTYTVQDADGGTNLSTVTVTIDGVLDTFSISGRYFEDTDGDDLDVGEAEPGISDIQIRLIENGTFNEVATTTSGPDGEYIFEDVENGEYFVEFGQADPQFNFVDPNVGPDDTIDSDVVTELDEGQGISELIVVDGADVTNVDAGAELDDPMDAQIGGSAWFDFFGDGLLNDEVLDPGFTGREEPVVDMTVNLIDNETGDVVATTTTDGDGNYLFSGLAGGAYVVEFVRPDDTEFTLKDAGGDDTRDSDVDRISGRTDVINLAISGASLTVGAGLLDCDGLIVGTSQADPLSPDGGNDLLLGCSTDDTILGLSGDDTLLGEGGNDVLEGESFRDSLDGGTGDDSLFGGTEDDILAGGLGDDFIDGGENDDIVVFGGNAADATISLSSFADREIIVVSEEGTDVIRNAEILRFADGDVGVDTIIPGGARDEVEAPAGPGGSVNIDVLDNDVELSEGTLSVAEVNNGAFGTVEIEPDGTVTYTAGADFAGYDFFSYTVTNGIGFVNTIEVQVGELPRPDASDPGAIVLGDDGVNFEGGDAGETIIGGAGDDDIDGNLGSDVIDGLAGDDALTGGRGLDLLLGGTGNDRLVNGTDSDQAFGESGNDRFLGQEDDDILFGGTGIDEFSGQSGSDFMVGGAGDDIFEGLSAGADIAIGGAGNDTFFWRESSDAGDRDLIDGESGVDRLTIELSGTGADATAVQAEVDDYLAIVAANEPPAGSINDGSVITGTYSFTTIDLDLKNVEDVLIA